jgi:HsdM N-terminal domain.
MIPLTKWLEERYSVLWKAFQNEPFTRPDAAAVLKEKKEDGQSVNVVLSELRKAGRIEARPDPSDARKKVYTLRSMREILIEGITGTGTLTREDLEGLLKKAADLIRTRVDYKFILILLFLKRISDKWEVEFKSAYQEAFNDGLSEEEAKEEAKNSVYHDFDLPEEFPLGQHSKGCQQAAREAVRVLEVLG